MLNLSLAEQMQHCVIPMKGRMGTLFSSQTLFEIQEYWYFAMALTSQMPLIISPWK